MTYGKDYGIKIDVPWYIKCPVINWFFNTCKVAFYFVTFGDKGEPLTGISGTFRIPFKDKGNCLNSILHVKYCFLNEMVVPGHGIYFQMHLLDVNHRKVYEKDSNSYGKHPLEVGYWGKPKEFAIWFGMWKKDIVDVTFNKSDFGR